MITRFSTILMGIFLCLSSAFSQSRQFIRSEPGPIIVCPHGPFDGIHRINAPREVLDRIRMKDVGDPCATIEVTYINFPANAEAAFQEAIDIWSYSISSSVTIRVEANWTNLGSNILGSAGPSFIYRNFANAPNSDYYASALADKIAGTDLNPGDPDIEANFNSNFSWYYGTDGNCPFNQYDLVSVVLHELGHGLGFVSSASYSSGSGSIGIGSNDTPLVYDEFMVLGQNGTEILSLSQGTVLGNAFVSNNLFCGSDAATIANGGTQPKLYAPATYSNGSSLSHWNESTFPSTNINALMTPQIGPGQAIHNPGPITLGLFEDMGWTVCDSQNVDPCDNDTDAPISSCHNISLSLNANGTVALSASQIDNNSTDNCQIESLSINKTSFSCQDIGQNSVTLTATDIAGNSSTCTATVTITDPIFPTITAPADVNTPSDFLDCQASNVTLGTPVVSDNCSGLSISNDAPENFPLGETIVVWTVTDAFGNESSDAQIVTITENVTNTVAITATGNTTFCEGGSVTLTATAGFVNYTWSNGAQSQVIVVSQSGTYNVIAEYGNGCVAAVSNDIIVNVLPDSDDDGVCDFEDNCPNDPNKINPGECGCGIPDTDTDNDGTVDCNDNCPNDPNKTDPGQCGCGVPDTDSDNDGTANCNDACPNDPNKIIPGECGCGIPDTDTDNDGTVDCNDNCPNDPNKTDPGQCGCGIPDTDSDNDGTANCNDACPNDPNKIIPGECGCGIPDTDTDNDGTVDCNDNCPNDPNKTDPGQCGCGIPDTDSDNDGTANCNDACPNDPNKIIPGECGCGVPDADTDNDGAVDCNDNCPNDPNKTDPGQCGCGIPDTDSDNDGTANCNDACPNDPNKTTRENVDAEFPMPILITTVP